MLYCTTVLYCTQPYAEGEGAWSSSIVLHSCLPDAYKQSNERGDQLTGLYISSVFHFAHFTAQGIMESVSGCGLRKVKTSRVLSTAPRMGSDTVHVKRNEKVVRFICTWGKCWIMYAQKLADWLNNLGWESLIYWSNGRHGHCNVHDHPGIAAW